MSAGLPNKWQNTETRFRKTKISTNTQIDAESIVPTNEASKIDMHETLNVNLQSQIRLSLSRDIQQQLMVCSHERSGTHFLMNTLGEATNYCANPWLNFDLHPLGAHINFFSPVSIKEFIESCANLKVNGQKACNASIIKSHFPLSNLGIANEAPLKIIYIWRDPSETLISYWRYMHRWPWNEGPKTKTPLELAKAKPSGQSQRYQSRNYNNYFERWAAHVSEGVRHCAENRNAICISYQNLLRNHTKTTEEVCNKLNIELTKNPVIPDRASNTIKGESLSIRPSDNDELKSYCTEELAKLPHLKKLIEDEE